MREAILLGHVFFGIVCIVTTVWIFVDVLHASPSNIGRIRKLCFTSAVAMWMAFFLAGYWYVADYPVDKAVILNGPWPFAHSFFMETKEHLVIILLLLVSYLPIAASANLVTDRGSRRVLLWATGMAALTALLIDGEGGIIATGVRVAAHFK
jgi:hypothetical protein